MIVDVDETRREDEAGAIDRAVARLRGLLTNRDDRVAHHPHVRLAQAGASAVRDLRARDRPGRGRLGAPDLHDAGDRERKESNSNGESPQPHARLVYPSTRAHSDAPARP